MAVVGEAHINVHAITWRVKEQIQEAFRGLDSIGEKAGEELGQGLSRGLKRARGGGDDDLFGGKFAANLEAARQKFNRLVQAGYFLGPAISGVVGAIGSLGAGLVTLVTLLSRATPAAIVLGGALVSLGFAAGTLAAAFSGVGAAIGAGMKAQGAGANNARAIEKAQKRLNELLKEQDALRRGGAEFERRMAEGARRLADATQAAADAALSAVRAGRAYEKAQDRARKAQERVTEAREEAKEALQQLRFELEGGAISEKKARLEFEKARESLQRVQDLPPNSRARQEAELAFAEAELNLRKAIDRNSDLQKAEAKASAAGVEGSKAVINAKEAAADAAISQIEAGEDAARADQRALDAANAALDAQDALGAKGEIIKKIQEDRLKLAEQIKDAEADLEDLKKGGAAANSFADAMGKLSKEAQDFVRYMIKTFIPALDDLKAAAGRKFFPLLTTALEKLRTKLFPTLIPLLESMGETLGNVANKFADVITEQKNLDRLSNVWKIAERFIDNVGTAAANLYEVFLILLEAAGPLIDRFGEWLVVLTDGWKMTLNTEEGVKKATDKFNTAGDIISRLAGILGTLFDAFKSIGDSIMEGGAAELLLTYFEDATQGFADLMASMNADGSLGEYFLKATENATKVLDLLGNIVAEILKLGDDEGVGSFVDKLSEAVDIFGEIGTEVNKSLPAFGDFIIEFSKVIRTFTESGSLEIFFNILTEALKVVNTIFGNETVRKIFLFVAPIFAATRALGLIGKVGGFAFKVLGGNILAPIGAIKKLTGVLNKVPGSGGKLIKVFKDFGSAAGAAIGAIKGGFGKILGVVKGALGSIGKVLMANPWILIIVALVTIVTLIVMNWDKIKEIVGNALDWISEKVSAIWNWITETTANVWNGIVSFFTELPGKILTALANLATTVKDFILEYHPIAILWRLITENWDTISTWFTELPGKILGFIKDLGGKVLDFINKYHPLLVIWRLISENWGKIKTWFTQLPGKIKDAVVGLSTTVLNFIKQYNPITVLWNFAKETWPKVYDWIRGKIQSLVDFFTGLPSRMANAVKGLWDGLKDGFVGVLNKMIRAWNDFKVEIRIPSNAGTKFFGIAGKGFTIETPNIPTISLAKGGIVYPSAGGTLAQIAEAGRPERVEPLDPDGLSKRDKAMIAMLSNGGAGATINVYPSAGMNERELAIKVSRELASLMRKGAA